MPSRKSRLRSLLGTISLTSSATVVLATVALFGGWWSIHTFDAALAKERKQDWQKAVVFHIIEKAFLDDNKGQVGITFDQIKERYQKTVEAQLTVYRQYDLSKDDLDDLTLRKLLLDLMSSNLIRQHSGKTYTIRLELFNPMAERVLNEEAIKYAILNVLTVEKGKHTAEELRLRLDNRFGADIEGYNYVINDLFARRMIVASFDENNKGRKVLWTATNCPTCPLAIEEPVRAPPPVEPKQKVKTTSQCCGNLPADTE